MDFKDLADVFAMTMPASSWCVRGSVMYWFLVLVFRLVLRRDVGSMGITDFLFVVLLGDAAQNGMIGDATSPTDAIVLISTLVFWNVLIDWATWRFRRSSGCSRRAGCASCATAGATDATCGASSSRDAELMAKVREEGLEDLAEVKAMYLESDGEISLIRQPGKDDRPRHRPPAGQH